MNLSIPFRLILATAVMAFAAPLPAQSSADGGDDHFDETQATTLFAFDDTSIPYTRHLRLEPRRATRHPANPVVPRGGPGRPDSWAVQFYGSVIREQERFRMWYVAVGDERLDRSTPRSAPWRVAYAESRDGLHWEKPRLGLVEYRGNRDNNLVSLEPRLGVVNLKVLRDDADPDPTRRYKLGAHVWFPKQDVRLGTFAPYVSEDGLRWRSLFDTRPEQFELPPQDLLLPALHFEPVGGLYQWQGLFHLSGQNAIQATRPYQGRVVRGVVSPDFVHWTPSSAIAFVRDTQLAPLGPGRSREGEQTHEGIAVWNRGNLLLGLTGIWHGAKEWRDITIDLGLVLSNDGVHFREPFRERVFLARGKDGEWDQGGVLQGQGFENIGDETWIYYGAWDPRASERSAPRGGVGIAVLPRDRFADLRLDPTAHGPGIYQLPEIQGELMTTVLERGPGAPPRFHVNVEGLGADAALRVELLHADTTPVAEASGDRSAIVRASGFQTSVLWGPDDRIATLPTRYRLRIGLVGARAAEIRLSAVYVRP